MLNQWANTCVATFVPQPRMHPKSPKYSEQQFSEPQKQLQRPHMSRLLLPSQHSGEGLKSLSSEATDIAVAQKCQNRISLLNKMCTCCSRKGLVKFTQLHMNQNLVHSFSHLYSFPPYSLLPISTGSRCSDTQLQIPPGQSKFLGFSPFPSPLRINLRVFFS